jgi:carbon monoxide dehydrogenase subunit G
MTDKSLELKAEGSILIARSIMTVFGFVCDPRRMTEDITPLEDHIQSQGEPGLGWVSQVEVEIAARVVRYQCRCTVFEPPTRLVLEMEGDVNGEQIFTLAEQPDGTRLNLYFKCAIPPRAPAYFHEEPARMHFAQTLVSQTLSNIQAALETG